MYIMLNDTLKMFKMETLCKFNHTHNKKRINKGMKKLEKYHDNQ